MKKGGHEKDLLNREEVRRGNACSKVDPSFITWKRTSPITNPREKKDVKEDPLTKKGKKRSRMNRKLTSSPILKKVCNPPQTCRVTRETIKTERGSPLTVRGDQGKKPKGRGGDYPPPNREGGQRASDRSVKGTAR